MKAPPGSSDVGGVFQFGAAFSRRDLCAALSGFDPEELVMPVWMEIAIDLVGYAGFIALATLNRSAADSEPVEPRESRGIN